MRVIALVGLALIVLGWTNGMPIAGPAGVGALAANGSQPGAGFLGLWSVAARGDDYPVERRNVLREILTTGD